MKTNGTLKTMIVAIVVAITFSLPALAREQRRGAGRGPGQPSAGRAAHPRSLLSQLIFPCAAACADDAKSCGETASAAALGCVADACDAEVGAAQADCSDDRRSESCRAAVDLLDECAEACLDTHSEAVGLCREALIECRAACAGDE